MKWNHEPSPNEGDERTVSRFLFKPLRLGLETRWLERANIKQIGVKCFSSLIYCPGLFYIAWEDKAFV